MLHQLLYNLLYPPTCIGCSNILSDSEKDLCTHCLATLPEETLVGQGLNIIEQRLYGQLPITQGLALYSFTKGGIVQSIIHQIKYHDRQEVATRLGRYFAKKMGPHLHTIDLIIPIPLHATREKQRGYNQSHYWSAGLAEGLKKEWDHTCLIRKASTESQTGKIRKERYTAMAKAFELKDTKKIKGKNILLVDDLLTTGATMIGCGHALLQGEPSTLSVAVIAVAR